MIQRYSFTATQDRELEPGVGLSPRARFKHGGGHTAEEAAPPLLLRVGSGGRGPLSWAFCPSSLDVQIWAMASARTHMSSSLNTRDTR